MAETANCVACGFPTRFAKREPKPCPFCATRIALLPETTASGKRTLLLFAGAIGLGAVILSALGKGRK